MEINEELKNYVINSLPINLTKLEQAIFIYILLCKHFIYDEVFFIMNNQGSIAKYHEDINNFKNISFYNNKIVCYEFNDIYAYFLTILGIKYQIQDYSKNKFTKGHANLIFKIDNFLVSADSVSSILMGDLTLAKLNYPVKGLICKNNPLEFNKIVLKIQQLFQDKIQEETKEDIEKEYNISNLMQLSLLERIKIITDKVKRKQFQIIDNISYFLILRNILFKFDEKISNCRISLIKDNESLKPIMIISLNEYDLELDQDETNYYLIDNYELKEISIEDLRTNFNNLKFEYFENNLARIPDINFKTYKK